MGEFKYHVFDKKIVESISMILPKDPPIVGLGDDVSKYLDKNFPFQFPPRITTDSKNADWTETNKVSYEPLAIWQGAGARKLTITAQYAVVDTTWNGETIAEIANAAKSYFYRSIQSVYAKEGKPGAVDKIKDFGSNLGVGSGGKKAMGPIVTISSLYGAVREKSTWRMTDVSIEYGDTFVNDGDKAYPLMTKITFQCAAFTKIAENENGDNALQPYDGLVTIPTSKWY